MAGNKYIKNNAGVLTEIAALQTSAGATDAGKIVALDDNGKLNASLGLGDKVDKVTGKDLSTNDFTDTLKTLLELKKVKDVTTDALNDRLVITYTDDTVSNLNLSDVITDIHVSGASLDATTNVLTLTSTSGGADVTVNLSDFVNSSELTSALAPINISIEELGTEKQAVLLSGTNIKTINGISILGSGNLEVAGGLGSAIITTPSITFPTSGATGFIGTITKSAFASTNYAGALDFAHWQLSFTSDFASIEQESTSGNLTTWTPSNTGLDLQTCYVRVMDGSDGHRSGWSPTVSFTTPSTYVQTPTLTVTGEPSDVPETPTLTTSAFSANGGSDTHASTDWEVRKTSDNSLVYSSIASTTNKLTINVPAGLLLVSTAYTFRARHNGTTYGSSGWVEVAGTTKSAFYTYITQGSKGFGIEPMQAGEPFAVLGLSEMTGTNEVGHDNYGNYIHTNGSIVCHYSKKYYRVGHPDAPQYATYGANSLEMVPLNTFADEATANAAGWVLHRAFIDGGAEKTGFFRDKYLASKKVGDTNIAVSVKNGNPIGLTTNAGYTPSSTMTGCVGQLHDAVTLSRARGAGWNNESVFMVGWSAMISIAQAQRATNTADVAWYDATGVKNFPKGCNNNARADINDTSVTWSASPDTAAKGLTGSASNFAKSTDNGANNGCADVNGLMYQVALGMTNYGTSATATTQITTNTIYVLKKTAYLKDLTAGWDGATDAWGNTTNLSTRYDAVTSPITISASASVYWGSGANQVLSPDTTGVAHDLCGFLPKNDAATDATGTSQFGNDQMYKYNRANAYVRSAGGWAGSASAGSFYRYLSVYRSGDSFTASFRACAYV